MLKPLLRPALKPLTRRALRPIFRGPQEEWTPADLFANGEQGSLWGPLPYYSDAAGTVEADWGDPVGFIPDASGNGTAWAQVTSTASPILGRVPVGGRRNLLTWTEDLLHAPWPAPSEGNRDVSTGHNDPDGGSSAWQIVNESGTGIYVRDIAGVAEPILVTVYSKGGAYEPIYVIRNNTAGINLVTTSQTPNGSNQYGEWRTTELDDGWKLVQLWVNAGYTSSDTIRIYFGAAGISFPGASWFLYHPDVRYSDGIPDSFPYQRVGNAYDITEAGVKEIHYLRFDGTDDQVATTLPAISGGTIVLAGTNGIWIDEIDFAGGAFSVGPDTYTGGPAGLMSILGDILVEGGFVIDRALTPKEIALVKGYYKARGAAGLFELGPELVVNGGFDSDTAWNKGTGWTISGGKAVKAPGTTSSLAQSVAGLSAGDRVRLRYASNHTGTPSTSTAGYVRVGGFVNTVSWNHQANQNYDIITTRVGGGDITDFLALSDFDGTLDNVSIRKLTLVTP